MIQRGALQSKRSNLNLLEISLILGICCKTTEGAMLFQTLPRLRAALATQVTRSSDSDTPVIITAMDAVLLSWLLLKRLG